LEQQGKKNTSECEINGDASVRIFLSAGEVSGDLIGANLAKIIQDSYPDVILSGAGGKRMEEAGVHVLVKNNHLGTVGIGEAIDTAPEILRSFKQIRRHVYEKKPDLAVLIGHDVFHLVLSRWLRARKIPTVSYFPPQVWLWRILTGIIARSYDYILTSFLEEDRVYKKAGANTVFVGHYLRDQIDDVSPERRRAEKLSLGIDPETTLVGLLPGSRFHELERLMPVFLGTVSEMIREDPSIHFVLPVADPLFEKTIQEWISEAHIQTPIRLLNDSRKAMKASDLIICCSGTATLEATLMGLPLIILYQVSSSTWLTVRFIDATGIVPSKTIGLPNLLAGRRIVPELIQSEAEPVQLAREAMAILRDPAIQAVMRTDFIEVKRQLGEKGGLGRAAKVIFEKALHAHNGLERL
jgi:lipid-A-disaccharide synthase